jgi:membrane-bound metal-dependent hydrolase YbcI (DUF457 family)
MPLLGHAFVGLATGIAIAPFPAGHPPATARERVARALWLPTTVVLAYLPDVATGVGILLGTSHWHVIGHSVLFAVLVSPVLAMLGAAMGRLPLARIGAVALGSVLAHDLLDMAQSTDRRPWWPFSLRHVHIGVLPIPVDATREVLLFGALFAGFVGLYAVIHRARPRSSDLAPALLWTGRILVVALMIAAIAVHALRAERERRLAEARSLLAHHRPVEALGALDEAERWPSMATPGRIDYLRAEAWLERGDRRRAEHYYQRADRTDPGVFWVVADLALFHASGDGSPEERQRAAAPFMERLRRDFAQHHALPAVLAKIERRLHSPVGG